MAIPQELVRLNTQYLHMVRDYGAQDPALAAAKFGLPQEDVELLVALNSDAVEAFASVFDRCVMALSISACDLAALLQRPAPVASLMAATRSVRSAAGGEAFGG